MVRKALAGIFLIFLGTATQAQTCGTRDLISELGPEDRARLDELVAIHPYATGNRFRATKGDSEVTVVGTIHLPDPRLDPIIEGLRDDVTSADLLVIEASAEDEAEVQTLAATEPEMFFITEGPTLIDLLSEEEWAEVTERLADIGVPGFLAAKFQPWYLSMTLAIPPCAISSVQSGEKGLDRRLENIALQAGVPIGTLDDTKAVLKLFSDESIEDQLTGLRVTLGTQSEGDAATSTLIEAYFDGRSREAWEFSRIQIAQAGVEDGEAMFEEVNQSLLIGRNQSWEPKIIEQVDGKDAVIAVGAGHLSGESGVLRSLERAGYTIAPY